MNIDSVSQQLIGKIKQTNEYNNAIRLKEMILQNNNLTKIVTDFQQEQEKLYNLNLPPNEMEREMNELVESFQELSNNTLIADYISAIEQVESLVYEINMSIIDSINKNFII